MSAGTITLTNNSATVTGSGTAFTSELTVGDFIVVTVGGIPYTLPIKTVDSNTSLTLVSNFTGPTQGGAAWYAVPRVAMNLVTAALVAQSAEALRGLNYDKQNWQQVYSAAGNITVKLPDGTTFTGPSWKYITDLLKNRDAVNTSWSVINGDTALPSNNTALKGGDLRSVYQINGVDHMAVTLRAAGLVGGNYAPEIEQVAPSGGSSITKKWTLPQAAGELVSKAETGYTSIEGKASGSVNGAYFTLQGSNEYVGMTSMNDLGDPSGTYFNGMMHGYPRGGLEIVNQRDGRYGYFLNLTFSRSNGTSTDHRESGLRINADGSTWMIAQPSFGSDIHLKSNITPLGKARDNLRTLRTVTFKMDGLDQMGLIAQDVAPHWPVAVSTFDKEHYEGDKLVKDGTFLSLNYTSMIAPAIKGINENSDILDAVVSALESALSDPEEAKVKLAALRKKFY